MHTFTNANLFERINHFNDGQAGRSIPSNRRNGNGNIRTAAAALAIGLIAYAGLYLLLSC